MKRFAAAAFLGIALFAFRSAAQAPNAKDQEEQQLLSLVKEVQVQQMSIAENQKKIDELLVDVSEAVRVARIYSSRGH
jgi:hypothetical protein